MKRVSYLYFRWQGKQIPVYTIEKGPDAEALSKQLEEGKARLIVEVAQYGLFGDVIHELIEVDGNQVCIQTIVPGGEATRVKEAKKASKRNGKQ